MILDRYAKMSVFGEKAELLLLISRKSKSSDENFEVHHVAHNFTNGNNFKLRLSFVQHFVIFGSYLLWLRPWKA